MSIVRRKGHKLAMDLAVALEVASLRVAEARRDDELDEAMMLNRRLWREVRRLAAVAADCSERQTMLEAAAEAEPHLHQRCRTVEQANRKLARALAGDYSSNGALCDLMHSWSRFRSGNPDGVFELWLLDRLDGYAGSQMSLS